MVTLPTPQELQAAIARLKERMVKEGISLQEAHDREVADHDNDIVFLTAKEAIEAEQSN